MLTLLYSHRESIPDNLKFGMVIAFTASMYGAGRLLWSKWSYERTGLAFILLSALLLPLNYYAAKVYKLLDWSNTLAEWGLVFSICAVIYFVVSIRLKEAVMPYVAVLTGSTGIFLFVCHFNPPWLGWGGLALTSAALLETWQRVHERYRIPLLIPAIGAGVLGIISYLRYLYLLYTPDGSFLVAGSYGLCLSLTSLAAAHQLRRRAKDYSTPALFAFNFLIFLKHFSTGGLNYTAIFFLVAGVVWGLEEVWRRKGKTGESLPWQQVSLALGIFASVFGVFSVLAHITEAFDWLPMVHKGAPWMVWAGLLIGVAYLWGRRKVLPVSFELGLFLLGVTVWYWSHLWKWELDARACTWLICAALCAWTGFLIRSKDAGERSVRFGLFAVLIPLAVYLWHRTFVDDGPWDWTTGISLGGALFFASIAFVPVIASRPGLLRFVSEDRLALVPYARAVCRFLSTGLAHLTLLYVCLATDNEDYAAGLWQMLLVCAFQALAVWKGIGNWRRPLRNLSWIVMAPVGVLTVGAGFLDEPKSGVVLVALFVGLGFYAAKAWQAERRRYGVFAFLHLYLAMFLLLYQTKAVKGQLEHFAWVAAILSVVVLVPWGLIGRERLRHWYRGGFEVAGWMAVLSSLLALAGERWLPLLACGLVLGVWAWVCDRGRHLRMPFVVFLCGATLLAGTIVGLIETVASDAMCGFALLFPTLIALVAALGFRRAGRHGSCISLLVLMGLTAIISVCLAFDDQQYLMFTFIGLTFIAGIGFMMTRWRWILYAGLALLQPAFLLALDLGGVDASPMRLCFMVMGSGLLAAGHLSREQFSGGAKNPLMVSGLLVTFLAIAGSVFVPGAWSAGRVELLQTILALLMAAGVFAFAAKVQKQKELYWFSAVLAAMGYYLMLHYLEVRQSIFYSAPPGLGLVIWGTGRRLGRIKKGPPWSNELIQLGMVVLFSPPLIQTILPEGNRAGLLTALAALGLIFFSMWVRVRWVFYLAIGALALDITFLVYRWIDFSEVPGWFWIGLVSVICIFIGFLSERRFNQLVREGLQQARGRAEEFFYGWS